MADVILILEGKLRTLYAARVVTVYYDISAVN